jgi:peroxiredoxin Q/BCP
MNRLKILSGLGINLLHELKELEEEMRKLTILGGVFLAAMALAAGAPTQSLPAVGSAAPDFTLKDQFGKTVSLSGFKGKGYVILYFYPKDETPGCTTEACTFRDDLTWYKNHGVTVLGVSVDNLASHQEFAKHYALNFKILSDADKKVTARYGVLSDLGTAKRTTFVIDKEGIIRAVFPNVKVNGHSAELEKTLTDLGAKA